MNSKRTAPDWQMLGLFAAASGAATALGSFGLALHGAGPGTWLRSPLAWLVGMVAAAALVLAGRRPRLPAAIIILTIVALAATLYASGQSGVHRWLDFGSLRVNAAALLLPVAIVALSESNLSPAILLAAIGSVGGILVAQPDFSQATAFLLAAAVIVLGRAMPAALRAAALLGMAGLALAARLRTDPLQPVPEVEGIFPLLAGLSLALAIAAEVALAVTCLLPLRASSSLDQSKRRAAIALSVYFSVTSLVPFVGPYPVPLVGLGMSFPVGFWLAVGLLSAPGRPGR